MSAPVRALSALAGVICRAQNNGRVTPMGIAHAVDAAGLHMYPETAAEHERLRDELRETAEEIARFGVYGSARSAAVALVRRADELVTENTELRARVAELEAVVATASAAAWMEMGDTYEEALDRVSDVLGRAAAKASEASEPPPAPELTVYQTSHDSIPFGCLYTSAAAARTHCEAYVRREIPGASLDWIEDEEDGVAELVAAFGEDERPTGYVVTALTVASAYDEEADE